MTNQRKFIVLSIIITLISVGCAFNHALDKAVWPSMGAAWEGIREDASQVEGPAGQLDRFEAAVEGRDAAGTVLQWPAVYERALTGIEAYGYSEPVNVSLRERLLRFDESVKKVSQYER